jgi:hypothetical protein
MCSVQSLGLRLDDREIMQSFLAGTGDHVLIQSIQEIHLIPTST